jgi:hypothetical protein
VPAGCPNSAELLRNTADFNGRSATLDPPFAALQSRISAFEPVAL